MKAADLSTITAVAVLAAALFTFLASFGVHVPLYVPAAAPLVAGVVLASLRAYIAFRGADNTSVDEYLATAEAQIKAARAAVVAFAPEEAPTKREGRDNASAR